MKFYIMIVSADFTKKYVKLWTVSRFLALRAVRVRFRSARPRSPRGKIAKNKFAKVLCASEENKYI